MKKSSKVWAILRRIISSPGVIRELFNEEEYYRKVILKQHQDFSKGLPLVSLTDLFPGFEETVEPYSFLDGTSLPVDIALLKAFARSYKDCRYLEIGTWRGESAANLAAVARQVVTINLPDRQMTEAGLPAEYVALHRHYSSPLKNVEHIQHDSRSFDFSSLKMKPDLIFIDGDHHYESVLSDTLHAFRLLEDQPGTIVWHDYAFSPESIRWTVLAGILAGCPAGKEKCLYHVSNTLCAVYTDRQLPSKELKPFEKPDKIFSVRITAKKT